MSIPVSQFLPAPLSPSWYPYIWRTFFLCLSLPPLCCLQPRCDGSWGKGLTVGWERGKLGGPESLKTSETLWTNQPWLSAWRLTHEAGCRGLVLNKPLAFGVYCCVQLNFIQTQILAEPLVSWSFWNFPNLLHQTCPGGDCEEKVSNHKEYIWGEVEEDLEKAMAPHSSTLAWKIPWTEEPGGLQSMGSLRVRHNWATSLSLFTFMHWRRKWQPTPVFLPGESQGWVIWWASVYGVTQSQTLLKQLSSSSSSSRIGLLIGCCTRNPLGAMGHSPLTSVL